MPQVTDDPFADDRPVSRPRQAPVDDDPFADDKPLARPKAPMQAAQLQRPKAFTERPQGDTLDPRAPGTRTSLLQDAAGAGRKLLASPLLRDYSAGFNKAVDTASQPGLLNKGKGALEMINALFKQAESYLSDPGQYVMQKLGASPDTQKDVREWTDALVDIAPMALTGGATVAARAAARSALTREAAAMKPEMLKNAVSQAYNEAGKIGVKLKPGLYGQFLETVDPLLTQLGAQSENVAFNSDAFPQTAAIMRTLSRQAPDATMSLKDMDAVQQQINEFVRKALVASEGGKPGKDLLYAQSLSRAFREFGDKVMASGPLNKARELASRKFKADDISWFIDRAKVLGDKDYLPQQMRRIALDPVEMRRWTPQEQKLIEEIARGSTAEDVTRAATSGRHGIVGRAIKVGKALRPVDTSKAEELLKLIARGKGSQAVGDIPGPTFGDRVMGVLGGP